MTSSFGFRFNSGVKAFAISCSLGTGIGLRNVQPGTVLLNLGNRSIHATSLHSQTNSSIQFQLKKPVSFQFDARVHFGRTGLPLIQVRIFTSTCNWIRNFLNAFDSDTGDRLLLKVQTAAVPQTPEDNK